MTHRTIKQTSIKPKQVEPSGDKRFLVPYGNEILKVEVLKSTREFAALEEEWEELFWNTPNATPFQSWSWLYSWWEYYGENYGMELISIRRHDGTLVGIIPLMLERRQGFGRLFFLGTGVTDYLDLLARKGWEAAVCKAGVQALHCMNFWRVADFHQLRPDAVAWGLLKQWTGPRTHMRQDVSPVIEVKPWEDLLASLSKNLRSTVRRAVRRAQQDGIHAEVAGPEAAEGAARRLVALHRESRQGRNIGTEHLSERFEDYMARVAHRMTSRGLGGVSEFWRDGEVIISDFWVCGHDFLGTYVLGASQEALQRYQWSSLYIWDAVNVANSRSAAQIDLLRGEEQYKLRWASTTVPSQRLLLGKSLSIHWILYVNYYALRSRAVKFVRSEEAPEYVKRAVAAYRKLRRYLAAHSLPGHIGRSPP